MVRRRGARKRIFHTGRHLAALPILFTGAGNRTSGPVLRSGSPRLVIQEAWAWLTAAQLVRASKAAALRGEHVAARALRRKDSAPVTADEESFTAARQHMIRSMTSSQVTASSSLGALAVAADSAARAILHTLNLPGRQRHSERAQKARPKFPTPPRPNRPSPENPRSPCSHPASPSPLPEPGSSGRRISPAHAGPRTVEPRAIPAVARGRKTCPDVKQKQPPGHTPNNTTLKAQKARNT